MIFRIQQFAVNATGEVEIQMVTYGHHPSALAASRAHQEEWFQYPGGRARTRSVGDPEGGHGSAPKLGGDHSHMEQFFNACQRTEEFLDRRYQNYLMREGSTSEIFNYFKNRQ